MEKHPRESKEREEHWLKDLCCKCDHLSYFPDENEGEMKLLLTAVLQPHRFKQRASGMSAVWQQVPATSQTSLLIIFGCWEQSSDDYNSM